MAYEKRGYSIRYEDTEFPKNFRLLDPTGTQLAEIVYDAQEDSLLLTAQPGVRSSLIHHLIEYALCVTPASYTYGDRHVFEFRSPGKQTREAVLQDVIFEHIKSTLNWIPVWTDGTEEQPIQGIPYFGPCTIREEGITQLATILESWRTIYEQGPHPLQFYSSSVSLSESEWDEDSEDGKPSRTYWLGSRGMQTRVSKPVTLENLSRMIEFAHELTGEEDTIYYVGIREGEPDLY